ncbi:MAG: RnfABCDGE type electron transport complex subunit A [Erysipelotrichaceae bacterium]|nr:RnfABCDGE type electron transport complex subunit A [Erysipelotrichaceae bacterium]
MNLLSLALAAILINNVVLTKYLGLCPFFGVSKNSKSAVGMGLAVTFVIFGASMITYFLYYVILVPNKMEYMRLITFILVIASFVQFVEMFIKKFSASLYKALGIYLPLITTNCVVLYVAQDNITQKYDLLTTAVNSLAVPIGYMLVLVLFSCMRERLDSSATPKSWKGNPIALVAAALMALAFSGLAGIV